jgi:hypothetical protein
MERTRHLAPNASLLEAALEGLEAQRRRVEEQIHEVRSLLGRRAQPANTQQVNSGRRPLSAAARKRIAVAQKKRWAAYRKAAKEQ